MIEKLKRIIAEEVKDNLKGYILILGVFIAGVALSCILNISAGSEQEINLYISDFISTVKNYSINSTETFSIAMTGYIKFALTLFFFSLTIIGSVGTLLFVFAKGFSYGAVFLAVYNMMGAKVLLFFMCAVIPHGLILILCFGIYSLSSVKNSLLLTKGVKDVKRNIIFPFLHCLICVLFSGIAALMQAYLEPILIRAIF